LQLDSQFTQQANSPAPAMANNLFTFLAQRFVTSFEANGLNCTKLLNVQDPVTVQTDGNGVATSATINVLSATPAMPFSCSVNGNTLAGCTGNTTINGQPCSFKWNSDTHQLDINCPTQGQ